MIFGVGAVIAMLSIGAPSARRSRPSIAWGCATLVRDKPPRENERQEIRKKSLGVSPRDAQAVQEGVPGVVRVVPKVEIEPYKVLAAGTKAEDVHVFGVAHEQQRWRTWRSGGALPRHDRRGSARPWR